MQDTTNHVLAVPKALTIQNEVIFRSYKGNLLGYMIKPVNRKYIDQ